MNANSMMLKVGMLLLVSVVFAEMEASDDDFSISGFSHGIESSVKIKEEGYKSAQGLLNGVELGVEVRGQMINDYWHTKTTGTSSHLDVLTSAVSNASAFAYQASSDKPENYTFGGRLTLRTKVWNDLTVMLGLGFENGMGDAKSYRPLNSVSVTLVEWDAQLTSGVATWKNNNVIVPAIFMGYCSLKIGAEYDMREFVISGHDSASTTYLDKTVKDNQVLYGFRGEKVYSFSDRDVLMSIEFMSNFGKSSDTEMKAYFADLAKYGFDIQLINSTGLVTNSDGRLINVGLEPTTAVKATVSSVNTNIIKASLGVGMVFKEF